MGRRPKYASDAERQRAYRERKREEDTQYRREHYQRMFGEPEKAAKRKAVSLKLVKVLGLLGSDHAGERDNAARQATRILKEAGLTWWDILDTEESEK
jgi:hypothetical protein